MRCGFDGRCAWEGRGVCGERCSGEVGNAGRKTGVKAGKEAGRQRGRSAAPLVHRGRPSARGNPARRVAGRQARHPRPAPSVTRGRALPPSRRHAAETPPPQARGAEGKSPQATAESGAGQGQAGHGARGARSSREDPRSGTTWRAPEPGPLYPEPRNVRTLPAPASSVPPRGVPPRPAIGLCELVAALLAVGLNQSS